MSLRIIIEYIIHLNVLYIEGIAIDDVTSRRELTRMWHELGLPVWLRRGRFGIIFSSLVIWKKS
jgi:hypothetical protein